MTQLLLRDNGLMDSPRTLSVTMVDALWPMMKVALLRNRESDGLLSVYERLALVPRSFDAAMAGFAIRDARDLRAALLEVAGILKRGGLFLIVDLSKPDSSMKRKLVAFYWRAVAPLLAIVAAGGLGWKFGALSTTFRRLPTQSNLLRMLEQAGFDVKVQEYRMLGGVCILLLEKKY